MHCRARRVLHNVKKEIAFFDILASAVEEVEQDHLVKLVLNASVVRKEEVLDQEVLDGALVDLKPALVYLNDVFLGDLSFVGSKQDLLNHFQAGDLLETNFLLFGHEFKEDAVQVFNA